MSAPQVSKVQYRRLGKSGLRVSNPILGCMSFGSGQWLDWTLPENEALGIFKAAWDRGVTTWDTANVYSNGESERMIAKALKKYSIPRERVIILTKCHYLVHDDPNVTSFNNPALLDERDYVNNGGLSRQAIFNQVEKSLERLETSYIDLLQIHRCDMNNSPPEETMKALHDLVQMGKVRYIGASSMATWQFATYNHVAEINGWTKFVSMQSKYNLLYREEEREMNKYCQYAGIGLIPYSPLDCGALARPAEVQTQRLHTGKAFGLQTDPNEWQKEILRRVEALAKEKGWTMAEVALAWINDKGITAPIVGVSSIKRLDESIVSDKHLTEEELKHLEEPYVPRAISHWKY